MGALTKSVLDDYSHKRYRAKGDRVKTTIFRSCIVPIKLPQLTTFLHVCAFHR